MRKVCGLDVHKDSVFMYILSDTGEEIERKFGVLTPELDFLRDLPVSHDVGEVAMENTGIYRIPIWRVLESDFELKPVNPSIYKKSYDYHTLRYDVFFPVWYPSWLASKIQPANIFRAELR